MIVQGRPEVGLQPHQQEAFSSVKKSFEESNKAAVVIPTGCGKSFIALQLMEEYKDKRILFLTSRNPIKNQMYQYICKYIVGDVDRKNKNDIAVAEEHFSNLKIMLYDNLLRVDEELLQKLKPDLIVMDELHRTGAEKWGEKINTLLSSNPDAKVLGMTATPDRMDNKNVVDELFEGNISYELTLVDAMRKGIVSPPDYVKCDYSLREELENVQEIINNCDDEETKKELQQRYEKMRRIVDNADGIPELFAKNLKNKQGKYIVFCKSKEHMDEMISKVPEWFGAIDEEPEIYSVYSGANNAKRNDDKQIKKFSESKSEHLKLLFSIEKLNEGLHLEDISGVVMLRPTDSRIVYLQQLGRALSSDTTREKTIIFDIVNNYLKNNLDREVNVGRNTDETEKQITNNQGGRTTGNNEPLYIDAFKIDGETRDFLQLLEEVNQISGYSSCLFNARAIKKWMEENNTTNPPRQNSKNAEEKKLGKNLSNIRSLFIKPYEEIEDEEEKAKFREKHPEIDEVMAIVEEIDIISGRKEREQKGPTQLQNARAIKKWMEENNTTKPPRDKSENVEERKLGIALNNIRYDFIKKYENIENEEEKEKFREKHPEIDEVMAIVEDIDIIKRSTQLQNARAIKKWMEENNTTKPPSSSSKNAEEKKLGSNLKSIRKDFIKIYKDIENEEEKEKFREKHPEIYEVIAIVEEIDIISGRKEREQKGPTQLQNARAIKKWMEENNTTNPPSSSSKNAEERKLGNALKNIRNYLIKKYENIENEEEKEKFREKHPEIDEVMAIVEDIDIISGRKNGEQKRPTQLQNARAIKKWMEENNTTKTPRQNSENAEEKKLGIALNKIRNRFIKLYENIENEEEKEKFREKHPEIDEVMAIVEEIDIISGKVKQKQVEELAYKDLALSEKLEQAKELERKYKDMLDKNIDESLLEESIGEDDE